MTKTINNGVTTKGNPAGTSSCHTYPLDGIDWFVVQAWQSLVAKTVWLNKDCSGWWPSEKLNVLHTRLQTLVTQTQGRIKKWRQVEKPMPSSFNLESAVDHNFLRKSRSS